MASHVANQDQTFNTTSTNKSSPLLTAFALPSQELTSPNSPIVSASTPNVTNSAPSRKKQSSKKSNPSNPKSPTPSASRTPNPSKSDAAPANPSRSTAAWGLTNHPTIPLAKIHSRTKSVSLMTDSSVPLHPVLLPYPPSPL